MCGIVGYVTAEKNHRGAFDRKKYMENALIIDTLRGDDSTGVFYQGREMTGSPGWYKMVADGYSFVNSEDFMKCNIDNWFMVGHNRSATVGSVNVDNAHPFQEGAITLVHNGTLRSSYELGKSQQELGVTVDSHALCHNLNMVEPDGVEEVISKIDGAFALVWHDLRDGSLNIVRNHERPLHLAQADDTIYFASEAGQLMWLNDRLKIGMGDVFYPEAGLLLKFTKGTTLPVSTSLKLRNRGTSYTTGGSARSAANWGWWNHQHGIDPDDDDDVPYTVARPTGNYTGPKSVTPDDNRVTVGGRRRDLPEMATNLLVENNVLPEDRIKFTPMVHHKLKAGWSCVVGHLDSLGMPAVIYHMQTMTVDAAFDRRWTIRPVAIKYTTDDQTHPMVVSMLVSTVFGVGDREIIGGETLSRGSSSPTSTTPAKSTEAVRPPLENYLGPAGKYVTEQEFLTLTAEGCAFCEIPLYPKDAGDVEWMEGDIAVCRACSVGRANQLNAMGMEDFEGFNYGNW